MHSSDTGEKPQKMERCVLRMYFDQTVFICSQIIYRKSHWQTNLMTTYFSLKFRKIRCCIYRLKEIHCRQSTCKRNCSANEVVPWCHGAIFQSLEHSGVPALMLCACTRFLFLGTSQARLNLITFQLQLVREGRNQCSLRSSFVLPSFQIWSQASSCVLNSLRLVRSLHKLISL